MRYADFGSPTCVGLASARIAQLLVAAHGKPAGTTRSGPPFSFSKRIVADGVSLKDARLPQVIGDKTLAHRHMSRAMTASQPDEGNGGFERQETERPRRNPAALTTGSAAAVGTLLGNGAAIPAANPRERHGTYFLYAYQKRVSQVRTPDSPGRAKDATNRSPRGWEGDSGPTVAPWTSLRYPLHWPRDVKRAPFLGDRPTMASTARGKGHQTAMPMAHPRRLDLAGQWSAVYP